MRFSAECVPDACRAPIARQMQIVGVPAHLIDEIIDLAMHAARETIDTLERVCGSASRMDVAKSALGIAQSLVREAMEQIEHGLSSDAIARGGIAVNSKIEIKL